MDIDLLSKMVKELIPDHDRVSLPGFGYFVTEVVPSSFSDRGYTINPPYRRLSFRTGNVSEDTLLADLYASSNGVEPEVAGKIISEFISEMKKILMVKKTVVFPGLGRMRATRENNFFFVADEDLDIYPEGFGLEPVSLKSHQETREEVSAMISGLQSMMDGSEASEKSPDVSENKDESDVAAAATDMSANEGKVADTVADAVDEDFVESGAAEEKGTGAEEKEEEEKGTGAEGEKEGKEEGEEEAGNEAAEASEGPAEEKDPDDEVSAEEASVIDVETEVETDAETDTETGAETDVEPDMESGADTETEPEPETDSETEPDTETEAGTEESEGTAAEEKAEAEAEEEEMSDTDTAPETDDKTTGEEEPGIGPGLEDTVNSRRKLRPWKIVLVVVGSIIGLAVLLLAAYLLLAHFCPDFIDSILYDSEQLDVIRYIGR